LFSKKGGCHNLYFSYHTSFQNSFPIYIKKKQNRSPFRHEIFSRRNITLNFFLNTALRFFEKSIFTAGKRLRIPPAAYLILSVQFYLNRFNIAIFPLNVNKKN